MHSDHIPAWERAIFVPVDGGQVRAEPPCTGCKLVGTFTFDPHEAYYANPQETVCGLTKTGLHSPDVDETPAPDEEGCTLPCEWCSNDLPIHLFAGDPVWPDEE